MFRDASREHRDLTALVGIEQFHFIHTDDQGRGVRHWANVGVAELRQQITAA